MSTSKNSSFPLRGPRIVLDRPARGSRVPALITQRQLPGKGSHTSVLQKQLEERQMLGPRPQRDITAAR